MPGRAAKGACARKAALVGRQPRAFIIGPSENEIAFAQLEPGDSFDVILPGTVHEVHPARNFGPVYRLAGDEIDDASDRVRPVGGRRAVLDDLHPLQRDERHERVDVGKGTAVGGGNRA